AIRECSVLSQTDAVRGCDKGFLWQRPATARRMPVAVRGPAPRRDRRPFARIRRGLTMFKRMIVGSLLAAGLAVCLAPAPGASADQGGKKNAATTPQPQMSLQPNPGWIKRHDGFVAIAKKGDVDVLFLGDSITVAWRNFNPKNKSGGKNVWDKTFAPLKAANFGIGGDRTQHVLWRIQNGELDGIKPKVAV